MILWRSVSMSSYLAGAAGHQPSRSDRAEGSRALVEETNGGAAAEKRSTHTRYTSLNSLLVVGAMISFSWMMFSWRRRRSRRISRSALLASTTESNALEIFVRRESTTPRQEKVRAPPPCGEP